ncbi:Retrovirus-related Pol polyprotein from transposon TNT 1-94 [Sesamum angolense]|uniref:Retrovirus-related Pol polyprotein from transposon TNT 1-94 n=1 Tax=Sesamum angolense TaxID=2727404 RepID=A0AAE2BLM3_9LAMI|nr:Retrovirus-related Pol polyprotein from transposon TNT 1-94 [Sesamum angolense]
MNYTMNYIRPDIAYAVSRLSRYTHNPNNEDRDALRRLLRYLKGTMNLCPYFNKYPVVLEGFCDANWVTDNDEVSSPSGYVFTLGQEAEWLRNLVGDIPLWGSSVIDSLHYDSQVATRIVKNYAYNGKRRHIRIKHGAVKELLKNGIISLDYIYYNYNLNKEMVRETPCERGQQSYAYLVYDLWIERNLQSQNQSCATPSSNSE